MNGSSLLDLSQNNIKAVSNLQPGKYMIYFENDGIQVGLFESKNFTVTNKILKNTVASTANEDYLLKADPLVGDLSADNTMSVLMCHRRVYRMRRRVIILASQV